MNDRENLRAKLKALLAKTAENGCTEAEAIAAAEKAAELMREYAMNHDDVFMGEEHVPAPQKRTARFTLWGTIAYVTNTAVVHKHGWREAVVTIYGLEPGPDIAKYLHEVCNRAMDREIAAFKKSDWYRRRRSVATRRQAVADFTQGMVLRLTDRLLELFEETIDEHQRKAANSALDRACPNATSKAVPKRRTRFDEASDAGWRAGANVSLHHGVEGAKDTPQIKGPL